MTVLTVVIPLGASLCPTTLKPTGMGSLLKRSTTGNDYTLMPSSSEKFFMLVYVDHSFAYVAHI